MPTDTDPRTSDPPLEHDAAARLDDQIQTMAEQAGEHLDSLADLLAEAKAGQIHQVLRFDSWTAYLVDRLKSVTKVLDADDRRELVVQLYEHGMSVRAIAEAVDASKSSIHRQVSQSGTGDDDGNPADTTGIDGKTYPRRNHGGGHRGPLDTVMKLNRAKAAIGNINDLEPDAAEKQTEICRLIEELLASIQPATESN